MSDDLYRKSNEHDSTTPVDTSSQSSSPETTNKSINQQDSNGKTHESTSSDTPTVTIKISDSSTPSSTTEPVSSVDTNEGEKSRDEDNSIHERTEVVSSYLINNYGSSSSGIETRVNIDTDINSTMHVDEESNDDMDSTIIAVSNLVVSTPITNRRNIRNSNHLISSNSRLDDNSQLELTDTATITISSIIEIDDPLYEYIISDSKIRNYILSGKMIGPDSADHAYDPSEIEEVINDVIVLGTQFYLLKWKKWSKGFNTWETFGALYKSQELSYKYVKKKKNAGINFNNCKQVNGIELMLSRNVISNIFQLFRNETGVSLPVILPENISALYNSLDVGDKVFKNCLTESLNLNLAIISLGYYRQRQLLKLKQWEYDINSGDCNYRIKVENNMDLEGPPILFAYVPHYIPHSTITIPDDPPIGCSCKKNCVSSNECCNELSGYSAVYDAKKNVIVPPGYPIYECNKKCKCTTSCTNRVVQLGSEVNVCIYKTRKYGWGVKASQNIQKGQFVAKYIGEIITVEESENRLRNGSSLMDYMWNLDFDDSQNYKYIIDGTHFANFTYFINHSCNANLDVYAVWINCLDRNLPELALFASRDILAGEQLTTNYFSRCNNSNALKKSGTKCQCDMKNCKGYYF